jgi:hypothetical protein
MKSKNKPLLLIFIDGLKPESLEHMPFLTSIGGNARIKGEYGYSIACHGSMYSGVKTSVHKLWFVWQKKPATSPFRYLKPLLKSFLAKNLVVKLLIHKMVTFFHGDNTSFFGIPRFVHVNPSLLAELDVAEKKNYDEEGYLTEVPSIFDIFRKRGISCDVIGMDKSEHEESKILAKVKQFSPVDVTYWFMGDVDHFSHSHGQESEYAVEKLKNLDLLLKEKYELFVDQVQAPNILLWSDHGHITVDKRIDPYEEFDRLGEKLDDYQHVIDGNFIRFWSDDNKVEELREKIGLAFGGSGEFLDIEQQKEFGVYSGDNRYGDIVFSLNHGAIFIKTMWGWSRKMVSMHGYNPNDSRSDGVVLSNLDINPGRKAELIDITPSILSLLKLDVPEYMEGRNFFYEGK